MFIIITVKRMNELQKEWGEVIPVQANLASSDGAEIVEQIEHPLDAYMQLGRVSLDS